MKRQSNSDPIPYEVAVSEMVGRSIVAVEITSLSHNTGWVTVTCGDIRGERHQGYNVFNRRWARSETPLLDVERTVGLSILADWGIV